MGRRRGEKKAHTGFGILVSSTGDPFHGLSDRHSRVLRSRHPVHAERSRSMGINKVILVGNVGRDPEMRSLPSGTHIATFSLATTDKRLRGASSQRSWTATSPRGSNCTSKGRFELEPTSRTASGSTSPRSMRRPWRCWVRGREETPAPRATTMKASRRGSPTMPTTCLSEVARSHGSRGGGSSELTLDTHGA
jgi:hypothetical protein